MTIILAITSTSILNSFGFFRKHHPGLVIPKRILLPIDEMFLRKYFKRIASICVRE